MSWNWVTNAPGKKCTVTAASRSGCGRRVTLKTAGADGKPGYRFMRITCISITPPDWLAEHRPAVVGSHRCGRTFIHPAIVTGGRNSSAILQMEPCRSRHWKGLTPADIETRFYDDRLELIPFDEPADLISISVETYTAKRGLSDSQ